MGLVGAEGDIISIAEYLEELSKSHKGLVADRAPLRGWFSKGKRIFFDAPEAEREKGLEQILARRNLAHFLAVILAREQKEGGRHLIRAISYRNIGTQDLTEFSRRFSVVLENPMILELQLHGLEYLKCLGFGYTTPEEEEALMRV